MRTISFKRVAGAVLACAIAVTAAGCEYKAAKKGGGDVTLTWLIPGDTQPDIASVMEAANKIIEPEIGAKLDLQFIDAGSFQEKLNMFMASQDDYDLCFTGYVNKYRNAVDNAGLEPLKKLMDKYAPELYNEIPEYCWRDATIDGEIYAVPNVQVEFYQYCYYIQKELAKKYNLDESGIKNPNDIEPFLAKIKAGEPNLYPFKPNGTLIWWKTIYEEVYARTMMVIDADGNSSDLKMLRDTPEWQLGTKTLRDWYNKGYIRKDISSATSDSSDANNNKYAVLAGQWKPGQEADISRQRKKEYIAIKLYDPYMINGNVNQTMIGIGANSKHKDKAIRLIELMNTNEELYNLIGYGIKGKHYNLNSENKVEFIDGNGYKPNASWKFGNQFKAYVIKGQDSDIWEVTKKMNDEAKKSPILGFSLNIVNFSNKLAQMTAILDEYESMNQGSRDYDEFKNDMVSRLKNAGEEDVYKEIQAQITEFYKNK